MTVRVDGPMRDRYDEVLTSEALDFLADLHRRFDGRRRELLALREQRYAELAAGGTLDFLSETKDVREDESWRVAEPAPGLVDRRAEITGPTDRKMTINALNSGARVWLADLEDANTPLWENMVEGQLNLRDAIDRRIDFTSPEGKTYALADEVATIVVRPRGWHLPEKHILVDGQRTSGSLTDFGLYFFHCAQKQIDAGLGPYFYLPKMESHLEARLWNDVFVHAQDALGIPRRHGPRDGAHRDLPGRLRDGGDPLRAARALRGAERRPLGLHVLRHQEVPHPRRGVPCCPTATQVTMTVPFMRAYTELLVRTCHKRGAHAIGGMAAFIPSKDEETNKGAFDKVRDDKTREAGDGFDGSWVAHPAMVALCTEVFDAVLGDRPNQLDRTRDEVSGDRRRAARRRARRRAR